MAAEIEIRPLRLEDDRGAFSCGQADLDRSSTTPKPEALDFYARFGFEPLEGVREGALHGGPTPLFLPLSAVAEAREGVKSVRSRR